MELSQESAPAVEAPEVPLAVEILDAIRSAPEDLPKQAANVMQLLVERGHVLPGAPPAQTIFEHAKEFAARLTMSNLALRILNMLAFTNVQTPETKPARKWIDDYLQGVNHGPAGQPMLWPGKMPGMAQMLRDWGFVPTIALPGQPSYVGKPVPNPTVQ